MSSIQLSPTIDPTGIACDLSELSKLVAMINVAWKKRWKLENPGYCFRGADCERYDLNPGILRHPYPTQSEKLAQLENSLWIEFRLRSKPLLGHHVQNAWEALLTMQQYGFPTRLLDWSMSLSVAAFFSVRDIDNEKDGAIWVMASRRLMELRGAANAWRTAVGDPTIEGLGVRENPDNLIEFNAQPPVPLLPDQFVPRMVVQHGIYTLHSFDKFALESLAERDKKEFGDAAFLHKIIIPSCAKESLRSELSLFAGVREDTLFPDLDGFARSFVMEQKRTAQQQQSHLGAIARFMSDTE